MTLSPSTFSWIVSPGPPPQRSMYIASPIPLSFLDALRRDGKPAQSALSMPRAITPAWAALRTARREGRPDEGLRASAAIVAVE